MKLRRHSRRLNSCVPVSTAEDRSPELVSQPGPVGLNKRHEDHLVSYLQAHYGWHLGDDGNLYSPNPNCSRGGSNAA
jgi:hypothetical protein